MPTLESGLVDRASGNHRHFSMGVCVVRCVALTFVNTSQVVSENTFEGFGGNKKRNNVFVCAGPSTR